MVDAGRRPLTLPPPKPAPPTNSAAGAPPTVSTSLSPPQTRCPLRLMSDFPPIVVLCCGTRRARRGEQEGAAAAAAPLRTPSNWTWSCDVDGDGARCGADWLVIAFVRAAGE